MTTGTDLTPALEESRPTPLIYKVLVILTMMSLIGGLLTAVMTYVNVGYSDTFLADWMSSLLFAFAVMPVGFVLMGLFSTLVNRLLPGRGEATRNLVTGVIMACVMESILAFSTTVNIIGFASSADFYVHWKHSFLAALPLGLTLMLLMSLTIKPRIERFMKSWTLPCTSPQAGCGLCTKSPLSQPSSRLNHYHEKAAPVHDTH